MKVLWLCNHALPMFANALNKTVFHTGGWMTSLLEDIRQAAECQMAVCFPLQDVNSICKGSVEKIAFYGFPNKQSLSANTENMRRSFIEIIEEFRPDVIHVFGTEYLHALAMLQAGRERQIDDRIVISIQGMVSVYGRWHYTEGLPQRAVNMFTLRDIVKRDNIALARKKFLKRGKAEEKTLKLAKHVIGRTDWDRAAVRMINPNAEYHFCNESLRDSFYHNTWDIGRIEKHTIFVSQCSYPIKGFHYLLQAMPIILREYPDARVITTGVDLLHMTLKQRVKMNSYQVYLRSLIRKYNLEDHVVFLGALSEEQMCRQYLSANVFVSPSTVENSPNSVGEAMLVGCPVVASDVGGVKNMLEHGKEGFVYQSSAPYMLAYYVSSIFSDDKLAVALSKHAREHAKNTHDRAENLNQLMRIYKSIAEQ